MDRAQLISHIQECGINASVRQEAVDLLLSGPKKDERMILWMEISGAGLQLRENPIYYARLVSTKKDIVTIYTKQIDKDLKRTFPEESLFAREETIASLKNILVAYSWRNPTVGYCQGLNYIVGRLLSIGFSEDECFWLLAQIVETYLPVDYFSIMSGVLVDQRVYDYLLRKKMPRLFQHLLNLEIDATIYTVKWFICMFGFSFPKKVVLRIWDHFFVKGDTFIFKVALGLMWGSRNQILNLHEFTEVLGFIESKTKHCTDRKVMLRYASKKKLRVSDSAIKYLREHFKTEIDLELEQQYSQVLTSEQVYGTINKFCVNTQECQQKLRRTSSFFTFQTSKSIHIIDDYVDDACIPKVFNTSQLKNAQEKLMLGKRNHLCSVESNNFSSSNFEEKENLDEFLNKARDRDRLSRRLTTFHELDFKFLEDESTMVESP
ncbi:unnamed protein product [Blepharisma stoltei]|uniref:Rab-GAP TBC domain-containing protein n=1 Tax=Blepharisma stoltei TaxID=1481888 RepID=A0AAU9JWW9_9CILI|nr:unnamed protein product [Blepharisma stoltei]